MKSAEKVIYKMETIKKEINRISSIIQNNPIELMNKYKYSNGETNPNMTYKEALSMYVTQKITLEWVLTN